MKKSILIVLSLVLLFTLSGCGILSGSSAELKGTSWTLESYGGNSLISDTAMTANFESGEISGSASCNHYFASYQAMGDQMTIEGLGWTEMACMDPEGVMEQEYAIMTMLGKTVSYMIEGGKLHLKVEGGDELVFIPLEK